MNRENILLAHRHLLKTNGISKIVNRFVCLCNGFVPSLRTIFTVNT